MSNEVSNMNGEVLSKKVTLYTVNRKIKCTTCGHIGGIQKYGVYDPEFTSKYPGEITHKNDKGHNEMAMDIAIGSCDGLPHLCTNCGAEGLINYHDCYIEYAFVPIESEQTSDSERK